VLVAGIGNIFLSDDGFGVEVVRRLTASVLPEGVAVGDFGIRGIHLAFEILDGAYDQVVIVDAYAHGAAPGTIVVFEPDAERAIGDASADGHSLDPASVLRLVRRLLSLDGPERAAPRECRRIVVIGCEPATIDEGIGLSDAVAAAVDEAVRTVMAVAKTAGGLA
jgi:hydrogenase maturation protease